MILKDNIIDRTERLLFGVVDDEFINIYSPENTMKVSGDYVYFLFNNVVDIHRPLIGYGKIIYDRFSSDMLKIYNIELVSIFENSDVVERFFNEQKFETATINNPNRITNIKMRTQFLNRIDGDILSKRLLRINSFFVREKLTDIFELRMKYCKVIFNDIEKQYLEMKTIFREDAINPHKFEP